MSKLTLEECFKLEEKATGWHFDVMKDTIYGNHAGYNVGLFAGRFFYWIYRIEISKDTYPTLVAYTQWWSFSDIGKRYWKRRNEIDLRYERGETKFRNQSIAEIKKMIE